ncbi:hypothetical protein [Spirosoma sp. KUDC1026]|uniref:hypothetical protein n=1 Tax=Spirosoma sp. KUDC1026 TaxID=2745947 RepID=UPI00159BA43B|nr:hypothetical protein [Spirosoma sp. KUDC1026]QKZ14317.1 hypothetical protein HU175_17455 [Spirosoma sp. KUDC1026]
MKQLNFRSYTLKYSPFFAFGWFVVMLWGNGQMLIDAFHHQPVILKGLSGVKLSLLLVEGVVLLGCSLVVGIGTAFIGWMFLQGRSKPTNTLRMG